MVASPENVKEDDPTSPAPSDYNEGEEEELEEEEIVYNTEDFISKTYFSQACTMHETFFNFLHSFGFESVKRYNICVIDEDNFVHWSGAIMHIVNISTRESIYRRCNDAGFGFITKHPTYPYLAVGEKGTYPYIIIYEWPNFNVIQVMKRGTKKSYNFLDFSPDGHLLASQGCDPDFTITIWHWAKGWVVLRCKSHTQEIYRAEFSKHFPGRLISSGSGHIKFWTMADTFTGLKLQGKIGKFGKTPISDTSTFYGLSDGLILSAAENGNMLIWENCEIKMEVMRGKSDTCHNGIITYFELDSESGDLFTIGSEGKMRCWDFASILKGKAREDRKYVSGLASFETDIKDEISTARIQHVIKISNDPESPLFYKYLAQDYKGSVWKLDFDLKGMQDPPLRIFIKLSGPIAGMGTSPGDYYVATLGSGGKVIVLNTITNKPLMTKQFEPPGASLIWLPNSMVLILGFQDGTIRVCVLSIRNAESRTMEDYKADPYGASYISCIQAIKPHSYKITSMALRQQNDLIASGSDDASIFIYRIIPYESHVKLLPVGLMIGPGPVYSLSWKNDTDDYTVLSCCTNGKVAEATFGEDIMSVKPGEKYSSPTEVKITVFKSVKSEILRDRVVKAAAAKKAERLEKKRKELAKMKEENPGLIIDEESFFHDPEDDEPLPELYYPTKACTIFFARYIDGRYWLSPSGYDAGFLYLYYLGNESPNECVPIADAEDTEITACEEILGGKYIFLGLGNGKIRIVKTDKSRRFDFSDYLEIGMHDSEYGTITKICCSHDLRYVYSCGKDSNLFSYSLKLEPKEYLQHKLLPPKIPIPDYEIDGIIPADQPSLQQLNASAKLKELEGETAELMKLKIKELDEMGEKMNELWSLNDLLPKEKRLTLADMELHPKFSRILRQEFEEKLSIWEKKLQFNYEKAKLLYKKVFNYYMKPLKRLDVILTGIRGKGKVNTFRSRAISNQFAEAEKCVAMYLEKRETIEDRVSKEQLDSSPVTTPSVKSKVVDKLPGLDPNIEKYVPMLSPQEKLQYDAYKKRREERAFLIKEVEEGRPEFPKDEVKELSQVSKHPTKLKTDPTFKVAFSKRITKTIKLSHIVDTYRTLWLIKEEFNLQLLQLRDLKSKELNRFKHYKAIHKMILEHIPKEAALALPVIPPVDLQKEYPEIYYTAESDTLNLHDEKNEENFPPELEVIDPIVMNYYRFSHPRSADLEEYFAINLYPGIIRLKKLQDKMIQDMNEFIENYDNKLSELTYQRLEYCFKIDQVELYLGTLLQEMSIISRYQYLEERTQKNMKSYLAIKVIYTFKMFIRKRRIAKKESNIEIYNEKIKSIFNEFQNMVAGSKYSKHLTRIFKKKYRPPKKEGDDDDSDSESSSSESESSSEADDEEEGEIAAYKFDETIRPEGCDPIMFNRLFKLRATRHELEAKVLTSKKEIAANQHEMVGMKRILKIDGVLLAIYQFQLDRISREKQDELNQVNIVIVVDSSQIQNWQTEPKQYVHPKDIVVASVRALKDLKEAKKLLHTNTVELKSQFKQHELHRLHLKKDINKFEEIHKQLLAQKKESLIQKFGIETNLYALDVEATRRLLLSKAYDVVLDERFGLLKSLKNRMYDDKDKLAALKKMHANNLFTLAAIESEKYKVIKNEQRLKNKKLHEYITEEQLDADIKNLEFIFCQQKLLKERLKKELRFFKFKDQGPVSKMTKEETTAISSNMLTPVEVSHEPEVLEDQEQSTDLRKSEINIPLEEMKSEGFDQDVMQFEDIFSRILKQVIPSETLIEDIAPIEGSVPQEESSKKDDEQFEVEEMSIISEHVDEASVISELTKETNLIPEYAEETSVISEHTELAAELAEPSAELAETSGEFVEPAVELAEHEIAPSEQEIITEEVVQTEDNTINEDLKTSEQEENQVIDTHQQEEITAGDDLTEVEEDQLKEPEEGDQEGEPSTEAEEGITKENYSIQIEHQEPTSVEGDDEEVAD